jgi:hypothetical protein
MGGLLRVLDAAPSLDHDWYDEDVRETLAQAGSSLARVQSKIKERIAE